MADPFVAEIRIYPFNFPPKGWAFCDGQLLPISQNTALFSLLGTTYGGDGRSTFALPDLQGRVPMHPGQGPGLSLYDLGQSGGSDTVSLIESELPSHSHTLLGQNSNSNSNDPSGQLHGRPFGGGNLYKMPPAGPQVSLAPEAIVPAGGDQPHNNLMPYLTLLFCIALQGVFPPRS